MSVARLYFDYNASAPLAHGLAAQIAEWLREDYKNPNSAHGEGQKARALVESSRKSMAQMLGLRPRDRLFFNSGGTESNNTVIQAARRQNPGKKTLVLTRVEHSCVYNYAQMLVAEQGIELRFIDVSRDGQIDLANFAKLLDDSVFLVSVMLVQNETGFIFPVKQIAEIAHQKGILVHTDAVCALGKMPVDFADLDVDYLTFSSHKFGALKGVGGVAVKNQVKCLPYIYGGPQELEWRAGTQNVIGIASSAYALKTHLETMAQDIARSHEYRTQLKKSIKEIFPAAFFLESSKHLPQTLSTIFKGLSGNLILTNLDLEGVAVSYGSACASGSLEISRVMREIGLSVGEAASAVRISFGSATTSSDIQQFAERLKRVLQRMQTS